MDNRKEISALNKYHELLKKTLEQRRSILFIQTEDYSSEIERIIKLFNSLRIYTDNSEVPSLFERANINIWLPDEMGKRQLFKFDDPEGDNLLESISSLPKTNDSAKAVLILCGLHYYFESSSKSIPQIATLLEEFYVANEKKKTEDRSFIIIISPKFDFPLELRNCVFSITPPYPDEEDIEEELGLSAIKDASDYYGKRYEPKGKPYKFAKQFFKDRGKVVYEDNKRNLINALKGLRICEINKLLAYGKEPYLIRGFDIKSFEQSKKQLVADSGLLKVEDVPKHYEDYVGDIEGLKLYMSNEKGVIDNRTYYNEKMPLPKGILLVGPPGCGKSETSKAIASILDLPLYSMDMGKLLGSLMGQSEHNFDRALSIAEAAQPCVLRIDEIEKAFAGSGESENDQTMTHIVGHFLTWMQERKSLVYLVATANNLDMLRPEFLRKGRWDEIFYLTYPSADGMRKILESCLKKYGLWMEDGSEYTGEIELDENGNEVIKSPIGDTTRCIIDSFYENNKSIKVSGAEIVDVIEQLYKSQFVESQNAKQGETNSEEKAKTVEKARILPLDSFKRKLELLSEKKRDVEIDRIVDKEILDIEINQLLKNKSDDKYLEQKIGEIVEAKYNKEEVSRMIESELNSLEINCILSGNNDKFNRVKIREILQKNYNEKDLIREEISKIKLNLLLQDEKLDAEKRKNLQIRLKEKYKDERIEEYYEARGYKSASTPEKSKKNSREGANSVLDKVVQAIAINLMKKKFEE